MRNTPTSVEEPLASLIADASEGDQAACAAIYHRFVQAIFRLAYGVLLDQQDAEEVAQDTFVYALRNLKRYEPGRSAFRTWLYTIAISRCRNKRRRKWLPTLTLADFAERQASTEPPLEAIAEAQNRREVVLDALHKLSPKLREAVVLRYFDGLSYREMAEVLSCPQKTAESRVRLAHDALYSLLDNQRSILTGGLLGLE
jgi:RNA polymerase sigma-70 factor (ECF subfamily)